MKGADVIKYARLNGESPGAIYFIDHPDNAPLDFGCVDIRGDDIRFLDLRFTVGMLVCITSDNEKRMMQLVDACRKYGARQIAFSLFRKYYS